MGFLIWNIILIYIITITSALLTIEKEDENVSSYLCNIIEKNFNLENSSDISLILFGERNHDYYSIIDNIYKNVGRKIVWSVIKYDTGIIDKLYSFYKFSSKTLQRGYIFLLFSYDQKGLDDTLWVLKDKIPWNNDTKFIVLTGNSSNTNPSQTARKLFADFWEKTRIVNLLVVVFTVESDLEETFSFLPFEDNKNTNIRAFTWFPYQNGNCRDPRDIQLLSEFSSVNSTEFLDTDFFPSKIPDDFQGCVMTVMPVGMPPYVITTNYTDEEGSVVYDDFGIASYSLKVFAERLNVTLTFLQPIRTLSYEEGSVLIYDVIDGKADFGVGVISVTDFGLLDFSIPILHESIKLQIPCPKSIPREKRLLSIFTLAVWLSTGLTFVLVSFVFWTLSRKSHILESCSFRKLPQCFQNSWAILFGVSVSEIPKTHYVRCIFYLYVSFCLALSTIFQAFFTTFLIEPGYEKGFQTIEEMVEAGIKFGWPQYATHIAHELLSIPRELKVDCSNVRTCVESTMFTGNISSMTSYRYSVYVALTHGVKDGVVCFYKEDFFAGLLAIVTKRNNPVLYELNRILRRLSEMGFQQKFWAQLEHSLKLKSHHEIQNGKNYSVFSVFHLLPVFILMLCGYATSLIMFIVELFFGLLLNTITKCVH